VAGLVLGAAPSLLGAWLSGYTYRQEVTINPGITDANLADFPLLVRITDQANPLFAASATGQDIVFTASDGTTPLYREIEHYSNAGSNELDAWVRTSVSATDPTKLYMYYSGDSEGNSTDTWNDGYRMVQHLHQDGATAGVYADSTSNGNNGTPYHQGALGNLHTPTGKVNGAVSLNSVRTDNDNIEFSDSNSLDVGAGTWEAWINPATLGNHDYKTVLAKSYASAWWFGLYQDTGKVQLWTSGLAHVSTGAVSANAWSHIAATWDGPGAGSEVKFYINGQPAGEVAETDVVNQNARAAHIGVDYQSESNPNYDYQFMGLIDEIRLSGAARSGEWIEASYNSVNGSFLDFGPQQVIPEPSAFLAWSLLAGLGIGAGWWRRKRQVL